MNKKIFLIGLLIILFFDNALAMCEIDSNTAKTAQVTYFIKEDSSADTMMIFGIDYPKNCLFSEFVNVDQNNPGNNNPAIIDYLQIVSEEVPCPEAFNEFILAAFPGYANGFSCYGKYFEDKAYLQMTVYGTTSKLGVESNGNIVFGFDNKTAYEKLGNNSSLTINFPESAIINSFSPKNTTFMTPTTINWTPFPTEKVEINYKKVDLQSETFNRILPILIILSALFLVVVIVSIYYMKTSYDSAERANYAERLAELKDKVRSLETAYMKRQIDETTYRRLFEQYQLQITDITTELLKEKRKKMTFLETNKLNKNNEVNTGVQNQSGGNTQETEKKQ